MEPSTLATMATQPVSMINEIAMRLVDWKDGMKAGAIPGQVVAARRVPLVRCVISVHTRTLM